MNVPKEIKPEEWKKIIRPGDRVFIGSNAACPCRLVESFLAQSDDYVDVEIVHILTLGDAPWAAEKYAGKFRVNSLFLGSSTRDAVHRGDADYTPCFLSEVPSLFLEGILPIDVALISVSPPDRFGYCSLGVSVDVVLAATRSARIVIAQINPAMPRTFGDSFIHVNQIAACLVAEMPLPELVVPELDDVTRRIGEYVSLLVKDGATMQMGIGKIPNAVLECLGDRNDLGIHTEMFSDGVIDLMEKGVINNRRKTLHPGKSVVSFCMGTRRLYDFVHENPHVEFHPSEYVNSPAIIARNDNQISINSAIEVDLTGQVVADSLGFRFYSGIGGQVDFIRGAAMSRGGRPIIALPATAKKGKLSRIVPLLTPGSGVVTSRGDVHYVVTEYGIATLRGRSIRERAMELIQVAHPDFRDLLMEKVREQFWVPSRQKGRNAKPVKELGEVELVKMRFRHGEYFQRPLMPTDERRLRLFFYENGKDMERRAHIEFRQTTRDGAWQLANIDQSRDLGLCIVERQGPREVIHAIGRFYQEGDKSADMLLAVRQDKRGMGMATTLLKELIRVAGSRKLRTLHARVPLENGGLLEMLQGHSFVRKQVENDEVMMTLELRKR